MSRKAIFLDIDGTLTVPGTNVPPASALKAVECARAKGHLVYLSSGRNYGMLSPLLKYDFDGVVASAGGYIKSNERVIYDCPMTQEESTFLMDVLKRNGIFRTVECLDGAYTDEEFKQFLAKNSSKEGNSELLRWRKQIESQLNILNMKEYKGQPIYKIVIMSPDMEAVKKVQEECKDTFRFCIQSPDQFGIVNGEVSKKEFDKGTGVELVCRENGVPIENSIAFGDSMNDFEMMQRAGHSVCMDNGSSALKEIADEICPSVEDDGLYKAFEKLNLL